MNLRLVPNDGRPCGRPPGTPITDTETLNSRIKEILDGLTQRWGVFVLVVELKDIELPQSMQRAMARQAEAERERRAEIIAAEGEALSAGRLALASARTTGVPMPSRTAGPLMPRVRGGTGVPRRPGRRILNNSGPTGSHASLVPAGPAAPSNPLTGRTRRRSP
ncbi:SPFH domain-containing protein [Kitasatospora sp. NPDC087861]|uniref:SPFH domain-containing protein n=1 Tax=Kitasatospora sp. NPDC087861 TaxID=3364070 RepID=UPI003812BDAD